MERLQLDNLLAGLPLLEPALASGQASDDWQADGPSFAEHLEQARQRPADPPPSHDCGEACEPRDPPVDSHDDSRDAEAAPAATDDPPAKPTAEDQAEEPADEQDTADDSANTGANAAASAPAVVKTAQQVATTVEGELQVLAIGKGQPDTAETQEPAAIDAEASPEDAAEGDKDAHRQATDRLSIATPSANELADGKGKTKQALPVAQLTPQAGAPEAPVDVADNGLAPDENTDAAPRKSRTEQTAAGERATLAPQADAIAPALEAQVLQETPSDSAQESSQRAKPDSPAATKPDQVPLPEVGPKTDARPPVDGPPAVPKALSIQLGPRAAPRTPPNTGVSEADQVRLVQRVVRAFQTLGDGGGQVRLRLSPPELGSIRLDVTVRGGLLAAQVEAETPQARTMLLENLPALRERLAEQNIKIERFEVDLMNQSPGGLPNPFARQDSGGERDAGAAGPARRAAEQSQQPARQAPLRTTGEGKQLNVVV